MERGDFFRHPETSETAQRKPIERATIRMVLSHDPHAERRGDLAQVLVQDYLIAPWGPSWWQVKSIGEKIAVVERDECADYLAVCQALGIVYEADGHPDHAGPISDVLREIARLKAKADEDDAGQPSELERLRAAVPKLAKRVRDLAFRMGDNFMAHGQATIDRYVAQALDGTHVDEPGPQPENAGRHAAPIKAEIHYLPGQEPYSDDEQRRLRRLIQEAADGDPGEGNEPNG